MGLPDQDQRTLPASDKRKQEFRDRGEIARSRDLTAVATLGGAALVGSISLPHSAHALVELLRGSLRAVSDHEALGAQAHSAATAFTSIVTPPIVGAIAGCLVAGIAQLGSPPLITFPKVDPSRLFNFGQIASMFNPKEALGRTALAVAKVAVVLGAAYFAVHAAPFAVQLPGATETTMLLSSLLGRVAYYAGAALALLAAIDYIVKKRDIDARMRMTPEEAKREHKQQEGDPQIKGKRRRRMRELARRRLKKAVTTADVVLVNPTEYAVALRYRSKDDRAPRVVAKGKGEVAERIREMARAAGVPVIASPPLCRLIHKLVKEGKEIPASLYQAVAEVMAYIYKLPGRRQSA